MPYLIPSYSFTFLFIKLFLELRIKNYFKHFVNNVSIIKKLRININLTNLNKKNIYYLKIIKDNLIQIKNGTINKISIKKFDLIDKNGTFLNEDKFKDFILESINLKLKHCQ